MADTKISALPAASTPLTGSEVVPLNQSGVTSNVTVANLTAGRNITFNNTLPGYTTTATAAGTTTLTSSSTYHQRFTGSSAQTVILPAATTMAQGQGFVIDNDSSGTLALQDGSTASLGSVTPGMAVYVFCENNSTTAGSWSGYMFVPGAGPGGQVTWGTTGLSMGGQTITNVATITSSSDAVIHGLTVGLGSGSLSTNTSLGVSALGGSNSGSGNNTAVGYQSALSNTTGSGSVFFGGNAGQGNSTGNNITAIGFNAGYGVTGGGNVLLGYSSGYGGTSTLTSGTYNVLLGTAASTSSATDNNSVVIGTTGSTFGATGKGSNTGFISPNGGGVYQGNNSTLWSVTSDERLKKNIVDNTVGLTAINGIKVRNFEYRLPGEITDLDKSNAVNITGLQLGVIAQELQTVLPDCVKEESTGVLSVDSSNVLWHLVTAVQELSAQVAALQAKVGV